MPHKDPEVAKAYKRRKYHENKTAFYASSRKWVEANREHTRKYHREYRAKNNERVCAQQRAAYQKWRNIVLLHYGNICNCCGEKNICFLTLDHIYGYDKSSGQPRHGYKLYRWIVKNNFPNDFQILCWNCNGAKGIYGICPHKKEI